MTKIHTVVDAEGRRCGLFRHRVRLMAAALRPISFFTCQAARRS